MKKFLFVFSLFSSILILVSCEMNTTEPVLNSNDEAILLNKALAGNIGINIVLNTAVTDDILKQLKSYGSVLDVISEINAVRLLGKESNLPAIQSLQFVKAANPDAERNTPPETALPVTDFAGGLSTWNLDAINVTDFGFNHRTVDQDGDGVYVLILDTGLLDNWPLYFPRERIASQYAKSFSGGGVAGLNVAEQPNKWEHDQNSHGTHVTSTILGYSLNGTPINGVAPKATIIPVKVLNQNGSGWSSVIAQGIMYAAELKEGQLSGAPVVVNMSLGGGHLDALEKAAIDYAISKGVIIVASAGNSGTAGMGYPGAYEPVISVAAASFNYAFYPNGNQSWWWNLNIPDPLLAANYSQFYNIPYWSSRQLTGQHLDVTAPGDLIVGPYQVQSGKTSYYYLSGTSMACPHVTGIVVLMLQKDRYLTASDAETKLESAAIPIPGYTSADQGSGFITANAVLALVP